MPYELRNRDRHELKGNKVGIATRKEVSNANKILMLNTLDRANAILTDNTLNDNHGALFRVYRTFFSHSKVVAITKLKSKKLIIVLPN